MKDTFVENKTVQLIAQVMNIVDVLYYVNMKQTAILVFCIVIVNYECL